MLCYVSRLSLVRPAPSGLTLSACVVLSCRCRVKVLKCLGLASLMSRTSASTLLLQYDTTGTGTLDYTVQHTHKKHRHKAQNTTHTKHSKRTHKAHTDTESRARERGTQPEGGKILA